MYEFQIEEVSRNGFIAWDAIHIASGVRFPVNATEPYVAGTFPEITAYLSSLGESVVVAYDESHRDSLRGNTWHYVRNGKEIIIRDIPRTIFRIGPFK